MNIHQASRIIEAVLFRSDQPMEEKDLQDFLSETVAIDAVLRDLQQHYMHRGVQLVQRGTAWVLITAPDLNTALVLESDVPKALSRAAMETLAIIAYYQPITRAEIEDIRGVGLARTTLDQLLDAGWVLPAGHRSVPGRPTLWMTTTEFLHHFHLSSLHDLPMRDELEKSGMGADSAQGELFSYNSNPLQQSNTD